MELIDEHRMPPDESIIKAGQQCLDPKEKFQVQNRSILGRLFSILRKVVKYQDKNLMTL